MAPQYREEDGIPRNDAGFMTALRPVSERPFDFPFHFLFVWGVLFIPHPDLFFFFPQLCVFQCFPGFLHGAHVTFRIF